jgi:two-component system CheB/CheR fusion protein
MEEVGQSLHGERNRRIEAPLVVGVGASAAVLNSIERLFSRLLLDPEQAVVLVVQHREAFDEGWLRGLLASRDAKVAEVRDGERIASGTIYFCAACAMTTVQNDKFAVRPAQQAPGERATIDSFLISLAEKRAEESIGVILAGTGGDGTLGIATLKDYGGLSIAEKIANEEADHLAESGRPAAIADFVLLSEEIPEHIQVHTHHLRRLEEKQGFDEVLAVATSLSRIADILRNKTGNDFHGYKQNTFLRRVQRRMQVVQIDEITSYVDFLRTDKDEVQHLFNDLLVGVTEFFRDKREFVHTPAVGA